jgi:outer membrane PBP1 activator LpoA protein
VRLAVVIAGLLLAGCGPTPGEEAMAEMADAMRAQTDMVERGVGLAEIFGDCTSDCSGHRAGYLWALEQGELSSEADCDSAAGHSFQHGCRLGMIAGSFE